MIMFSKQEFSPNIDMFLAFICFWNSTISAFEFPFGIISPFLVDVATMLSLPIIGEKVATLYNEAFVDIGCIVYKEIAGYGNFMNEYR